MRERSVFGVVFVAALAACAPPGADRSEPAGDPGSRPPPRDVPGEPWPAVAPSDQAPAAVDPRVAISGFVASDAGTDLSDSGTGGCSAPLPPPLDLLRVVIYNDMGEHKVLDSTPLIYNREYCAAIGFTDGRVRCQPRQEGSPETEACNAVAVGYAEDTGRVGPSWTYNGAQCDGSGEPGTCRNHSSNQFLLHVYGSGLARACTAAGVCGEVEVP